MHAASSDVNLACHLCSDKYARTADHGALQANQLIGFQLGRSLRLARASVLLIIIRLGRL